MAKEASLSSLNMMLGRDDFEAGGHRYTVLPLKLKEVRGFTEGGIFGYNPAWLVTDEEKRAQLDSWLRRQVRTDKGEPVTLAMVEDGDWTTDDLRRFLDKLAGISG